MVRKLANLNKFKILSEFCNDVAKGLMIAGILGQVVSDVPEFKLKLFLSIYAILVSLIFLYFSVLLSYKYD